LQQNTSNKNLHGGWRMSKVTELFKALKDGDVSVRRKTVDKLRLIKDPRAIEPLISALGDVDNDDVYLTIKEALDTINPDWKDSKEARLQVSELIAALLDEDENSNVRQAAAEALGYIQDPRAVEPLVAALLDENENNNVRSTASWALGKIKDPRAVEPLTSALEDGNEYVRKYASWALHEINPDWEDLLKK
jgi:HEAT repeat protein